MRKSQYFPFWMFKGTTGTIFITSLVWRSPWLGIKPGTTRTRSQHSTTRQIKTTQYCRCGLYSTDVSGLQVHPVQTYIPWSFLYSTSFDIYIDIWPTIDIYISSFLINLFSAFNLYRNTCMIKLSLSSEPFIYPALT